ncbi:hypothetical protein FACS1894132_00870 [Clostridia bacterium]|nr:hypothetical protein FACS1894132_00870 [Clostridia bacterium]
MNNAVFPFSFGTHLVFAVFSAVFFILQFARLKYKYHLIMAIAIPFSLLIYVANNKPFFYAIGIIEVVFLLACAVNLSIERKKFEAMHTIRETMEVINSDENTATKPEFEPSGLVEVPRFDKTDSVGTGWLDAMAKENAPPLEEQEEKPKQLKTGWVDTNFKD